MRSVAVVIRPVLATRVLCALTLAWATILYSAAAWADASIARATLVDGRVERVRKARAYTSSDGPSARAPWRRVRQGMGLRVGDAVRTGAKGRLELTLGDGSRLRLGPSTVVTLSRAHFDNSGRRQVTVRMWLGRLWAQVTRRLGRGSAFEVKTRNAVAGVRGTSFAVLANADLSSVVKVYTGTVGVRTEGLLAGSKRVRVAGPQRVDRRQWEEVIATAMRQVRVTQLGEIQPAEDFVDSGPDEAWAMWNRDRDEGR